MSNDGAKKPEGVSPALPAPKKLKPELQNIINKADKDESFYDELYDGKAPESTDSNIRYAAYATRVRTALLSAQRYVAYTSDIGESFRPIAHPNLVRTAYGISWAYLIGDVSNEGYKAYCANQRVLFPGLPREAVKERYNDGKVDFKAEAQQLGADLTPGKVPALEHWGTVVAQRAIFQSIASMGLPAFTIHSIVRYSGRWLKDSKNPRIRGWGPIGLGLAAVPALPYMFDQPVENAVEWIFHKGFQTFGGPEAVGHARATGREDALSHGSKKNKEL